MGANEKLNLEIAAQTTGQESVDRLSESLKRFSAGVEIAGGSLAKLAANNPFEGWSGAIERDVISPLGKAAKGAIELAGAHALLTGSIKDYALTASHASGITDTLVNSYRAVRIALAPTMFTAASIGVGILAEETLRLVNARGKLIQQQSLLAATSGLQIGDVERIGSISRLSGTNSSDITSALKALQARSGTAKYSSALESIGVPKFMQDEGSPRLLSEIAKGFSDIEDPVARAQAAVDLFGVDLAGKVLPELNRGFADSAKAVDTWGLTLSDTSRNQIYGFHRDLQNFKDDITGLGTGFEALGAKIEQALTVGAARAYAATKGGLSTLGQIFGGTHQEFLKGAYGVEDGDVLSSAVFGPDTDPQRLLEYASKQNLASANAYSGNTGSSLLQRSVLNAREEYSKSRPGIEAELSRQRERLNRSDAAIQNGDSSVQQLAAYQAANQGVTRAASRLKAMDDAEKADRALIEDRKDAAQAVASNELRALRNPIVHAYAEANAQQDRFSGSADSSLRGKVGQSTMPDIALATQAEQKKSISDQLEQYAKSVKNDETFFLDTLRTGTASLERAQEAANRVVSLQDSLTKETGTNRVRRLTDAGSFAGRMTSIDPRLSDSRKILELGRLDLDTAKARYGIEVQTASALMDEKARADAYNEANLNQELALQKVKEDGIERLAELQNKKLNEFGNLVGGIFDAAASRAIPQFVRSQGLGLARTITENAAKQYLYPAIQKMIPQSDSPLLRGTMLEKIQKDPALAANTGAIDRLTAEIEKMAGFGSSGGGMNSGGGGQYGSIYGSATNNPYVFNATGSAMASPGDPGTADAGWESLPIISRANYTSGSGFGFNGGAIAKAAGIGLEGYQAFKGFEKGGAGGALEGVSGVLGAGAGIAAMVGGPAGMAVGAGLAIASAVTGLVGSFLDGATRRANAISTALGQAQYNAPTALNVTQSAGGTFADFDAKGNLRTSNFSPYPQVTQGYTWEQTHGLFGGPPTFTRVPGGQTSQYGAPVAQSPTVINNYTIHAIDTQSFADALNKHHRAVGDAAAKNLQDAHGSLSSEIDRRLGG